MTRPVTGFLTKDGKFFDTRIQADRYEAAVDFYAAVADGIDMLGLQLGTAGEQYVTDIFKAWLLTHKDQVQRYLETNGDIAEAAPPSEDDIRSDMYDVQAAREGITTVVNTAVGGPDAIEETNPGGGTESSD